MTMISDFPMSDAEKEAYKNYAISKNKGKEVVGIEIKKTSDSDFVDIKTEFKNEGFDRIRRITGYLVGSTDRWNDAKLSELGDREKHEVNV